MECPKCRKTVSEYDYECPYCGVKIKQRPEKKPKKVRAKAADSGEKVKRGFFMRKKPPMPPPPLFFFSSVFAEAPTPNDTSTSGTIIVSPTVTGSPTTVFVVINSSIPLNREPTVF